MLGSWDIGIADRRCFSLLEGAECIYSATHERTGQRIVLDKAGDRVSTHGNVENPRDLPGQNPSK